MKRLTKVMSVVLAFIMLFGTVVYSQAKTVKYLKCDVDLDGEVTAADARLILRCAVGLEEFTDLQKLLGDYDSDGEITAGDARMALRSAVGLEVIIEITEGYFTYTGYEFDSYDDIPGDTWYYHLHDGRVDIEYKPGKHPGKEEPHEKYTPETDPYYYMPSIYESHPEVAGLYYNAGGIHVDYEDIAEGDLYWYFDSNGHGDFHTKPYSPGNEPDPNVCPFCGKVNYMGKGVDPCANGGCSRWTVDHTCEHCGTFVPARTCHTCP